VPLRHDRGAVVGLDDGAETSAFYFAATDNDADASATIIRGNACLQQAP
jgi:hypothetical protein